MWKSYLTAVPEVGDDPALGGFGQDVERGEPDLLSKESGVHELELFVSETLREGPIGGKAELA